MARRIGFRWLQMIQSDVARDDRAGSRPVTRWSIRPRLRRPRPAVEKPERQRLRSSSTSPDEPGFVCRRGGVEIFGGPGSPGVSGGLARAFTDLFFADEGSANMQKILVADSTLGSGAHGPSPRQNRNGPDVV